MRHSIDRTLYNSPYLHLSTHLPPQITALLCIGGMDKRAQIELVQKQGVHLVVATPGRLRDLLAQKKMNLNICRYFCLDEVRSCG